MKKLSLFFMLLSFGYTSMSQCEENELEVSLEIATDNWGYEIYWEIVPSGNSCGEETVASGGNSLVGCDGGGAQDQPSGGYASNSIIEEGEWCLEEGQSYDIIYTDDWGDGGAEFNILIDGFPLFYFEGTGAVNTFSFTVEGPPELDMAVLNIQSYGYQNTSNVPIHGHLFNFGSETVNSVEIALNVDGELEVSETIEGMSLEGYEEFEYEFTEAINIPFGEHEIEVEILSVNGASDEDESNNKADKVIYVGNPIPNVIDGYVDIQPEITIINNSGDLVSEPTDLAFHPSLNRFELWVVNRGTENSGGSTVTFEDAGLPTQSSEWKQDGNAWHFMSLPTAIDFGENENFATSAGVYDSNHDGGTPFTGPALWSSDPDIYAQPSGGNGSHLDMLHASPYGQGIAHEEHNIYWLVDGYNSDVVMYDFAEDHGPGNSFHGDAIIHRFNEFSIEMDPQNHIVSHCDFDKSSGWLYVVDHGGQRIMRLNSNSGTLGSTPSFGPFEMVEEYKYIDDYEWEVVVDQDLDKPAGIDVIGDRMIVSDYATGEVIIYDISEMPATELERLETDSEGIMGITIGPWGRIWFADTDGDEIGIIEGNPLSISNKDEFIGISFYPNPTQKEVNISNPYVDRNVHLEIYDQYGKLLNSTQLNHLIQTVDVSIFPTGMYHFIIQDENGQKVYNERIVVTH